MVSGSSWSPEAFRAAPRPPACGASHKGRSWIKCPCPIWCDGEVDGKRVRRSLETRDWARAARKLGAIEDPSINLRSCAQPGCNNRIETGTRCELHSRTVERAIIAFHDAHQDVSPSTKLNYRRVLRLLGEFTAARGITRVDRIDLDTLNAFRVSRNVNPRTWTKELGTIRQFFRHCLDNEWIHRNWAEKVPMPKILKPAAREPYTPNEIAQIIGACDQMGRGPYERLRARAMILLCDTRRSVSPMWPRSKGSGYGTERSLCALLRTASPSDCLYIQPYNSARHSSGSPRGPCLRLSLLLLERAWKPKRCDSRCYAHAWCSLFTIRCTWCLFPPVPSHVGYRGSGVGWHI